MNAKLSCAITAVTSALLVVAMDLIDLDFDILDALASPACWLVCGLLCAGFFASTARAAVTNVTWIGGAGNYSDTTKWVGGVVPINGANSFVVFIDSGN